MCCRKKAIIRRIKKTQSFIIRDKYYLILGIEPYKDPKRESAPLRLEKNVGDYSFSSGKVAFLPKGKTFPASFMAICKLLFDSVDILEEMYKQGITTDRIAMFLHNEGYLLMNISEVDEPQLPLLIKKCNKVFFLGESNDLNNIKKASTIKQYADVYNVSHKLLYHPSANNIDKQTFTNQYIKHEGDLKDLIIKPKCCLLDRRKKQ